MTSSVAVLALLGRIEAEWCSLRPRIRGEEVEPPPWGVWIKLLSTLPDDADDPSLTYEEMLNRVQAVWFLDGSGIRAESVWAYHRFITVHHRRPWSARFYETSLPWGRSYHQIGSASIAPYEDGEHWYYDFQWGGLYGRGFRCAVDERGEVRGQERLWVS